GPEPVQLIHFCRLCGSPWDSGLNQCPRCVQTPSATTTPRPKAQADGDSRDVMSAIGLYFALLSISLATMIWIVATWATHSDHSLLRVETWESVAMSLLVLGWAIAKRDLLRDAFRIPGMGWMLAAVPLGMATFLMAHLLLHTLHRVLGLQLLDMTREYQPLPHGMLWALLSICVQPALFEELGFRGVILPSLNRVLTTTEAITVTALLFGILHLTVLSLPHLVALGWIAGWLRCRSGSLYPAMILHFTHNLLVVLVESHGGPLRW
ncbi:MAG: lysostaphin resistance A-like protein, partial [Tepidisphaeraceae bacterium]